MNTALAIPEIVALIATYFSVDSSSQWYGSRQADLRVLRSFALVNRLFCEYALDEKWRSCSVYDIARMMPRSMWTECEEDYSGNEAIHGRVRILRLSLTHRHSLAALAQERFFFYSRRIHQLQVFEEAPDYGSMAGPCLKIDTKILHEWGRLQTTLLPRLSSIDSAMRLGVMSSADAQGILSLVTPAITTLVLKFEEDAIHALHLGDGQYALIQCPRLRHITIETGVDDALSWRTILRTLIRGSLHLETVLAPNTIVFEAATMIHLGSCPNLRVLRAYKIAPFSTSDSGVGPGAFPALESWRYLPVSGPQAMLASSVLAHSHTQSLRELCFGGREDAVSFGIWRSLLSSLKRYTQLDNLELVINITGRPPDFWQAVLESLMDMASLEQLRVCTDFGAVLHEGALIHYVSHWPAIRRLEFIGSNSWEDYSVVVSLAAFITMMSLCPHLEYLHGVSVSCVSLPPGELVDCVEAMGHSLVYGWMLQDAQSSDVEDVALVLHRVLPQLESVHNPNVGETVITVAVSEALALMRSEDAVWTQYRDLFVCHE